MCAGRKMGDPPEKCYSGVLYHLKNYIIKGIGDKEMLQSLSGTYDVYVWWGKSSFPVTVILWLSFSFSLSLSLIILPLSPNLWFWDILDPVLHLSSTSCSNYVPWTLSHALLTLTKRKICSIGTFHTFKYQLILDSISILLSQTLILPRHFSEKDYKSLIPWEPTMSFINDSMLTLTELVLFVYCCR